MELGCPRAVGRARGVEAAVLPDIRYHISLIGPPSLCPGTWCPWTLGRWPDEPSGLGGPEAVIAAPTWEQHTWIQVTPGQL